MKLGETSVGERGKLVLLAVEASTIPISEKGKQSLKVRFLGIVKDGEMTETQSSPWKLSQG